MIYERKEFTLKNGLKITVKSPNKSEAKQLLDFIIKAAGQTPFLLSTPEDFSSRTVEKEEIFIESFTDSKNYLIAVYSEGEIIGDCSIDFYRHAKDCHRCNIGIGIDKKFHNMGIGSILFDEMIRLASETAGIEQMELGVFSSNEIAIHLYRKKGFEETGRIPNAFKLEDGTYNDEILMTKFL